MRLCMIRVMSDEAFACIFYQGWAGETAHEAETTTALFLDWVGLLIHVSIFAIL